jgi:hypothetical protein
MEETKQDFRYKMEHLGDILIDHMERVCSGVRASVGGVGLTYDIHHLKKKRSKMVMRIGERVVTVRKDDPALNLATDETALALFAEYDRIQEKLEADIAEREARINRWRFAHEGAD